MATFDKAALDAARIASPFRTLPDGAPMMSILSLLLIKSDLSASKLLVVPGSDGFMAP